MDVVSKFISFKELFPRLYKTVPGLIKGGYYCITAATNVGKSKFAKFLFVSFAYNYCKKHNIPLRIVYFALEESEEKFWITLKCDLIFEKYGTTITYYQYKGYHEGLTDEIRAQLDTVEPIIIDMKKYIFVETISNPTGIYLTIKDHLLKVGTEIKKSEFTDKNKNTHIINDYIYHNPDTHVIVVLDHNILVSPEKNPFNDCSTTHAAMTKVSSDIIKLCNNCKIIFCSVHQQESNNENVNNIKLDNLQPTLSKLGVNKVIQQDYHIVFGLFAPNLYKLTNTTNYDGYNIKKFKNNFRQLSILKHRDGNIDLEKGLPLYFDGRLNYFEELPPPNDLEINKIYEKLENLK